MCIPVGDGASEYDSRSVVRHVVLSGATDGRIMLWDVNEQIEQSSVAKERTAHPPTDATFPSKDDGQSNGNKDTDCNSEQWPTVSRVFAMTAHQSGVNSLDVKPLHGKLSFLPCARSYLFIFML